MFPFAAVVGAAALLFAYFTYWSSLRQECYIAVLVLLTWLHCYLWHSSWSTTKHCQTVGDESGIVENHGRGTWHIMEGFLSWGKIVLCSDFCYSFQGKQWDYQGKLWIDQAARVVHPADQHLSAWLKLQRVDFYNQGMRTAGRFEIHLRKGGIIIFANNLLT